MKGRLDREARNAMAVLLQRGSHEERCGPSSGCQRGHRAVSRPPDAGGSGGRPLASAWGGCGAWRGDRALAGALGSGCGRPGGAACVADPRARVWGQSPLGATLLQADASDAGVAYASLGGDPAGGAGTGGLGAFRRRAGGLGAGGPDGVSHGAVVELERGGGVVTAQGHQRQHAFGAGTVVVVQVPVARRRTQHPLRSLRRQTTLDARHRAVVPEAPHQTLRHPEPAAIHFPQEQHATVHRQPATVEPAHPRPTAKTFKCQLGWNTLLRRGAAPHGVGRG